MGNIPHLESTVGFRYSTNNLKDIKFTGKTTSRMFLTLANFLNKELISETIFYVIKLFFQIFLFSTEKQKKH